MRGDLRSASRSGHLILFVLVSVCLAYPSIGAAESLSPKTTESTSQKTVLVLHAYGSQSTFRPLFDRALQQTLDHNGFEDAEIYVETLESNRFPRKLARGANTIGARNTQAGNNLASPVWIQHSYALSIAKSCFPTRHPARHPAADVSSDANIAQVTAGDHFLDTASPH
jgi:hypothetical protein